MSTTTCTSNGLCTPNAVVGTGLVVLADMELTVSASKFLDPDVQSAFITAITSVGSSVSQLAPVSALLADSRRLGKTPTVTVPGHLGLASSDVLITEVLA